MKSHLPIPAFAGMDLSKYLIKNGKSITLEVESADEGGIMCLLDLMNPEAFVISITLIRVKLDHPLFDKISAY